MHQTSSARGNPQRCARCTATAYHPLVHTHTHFVLQYFPLYNTIHPIAQVQTAVIITWASFACPDALLLPPNSTDRPLWREGLGVSTDVKNDYPIQSIYRDHCTHSYAAYCINHHNTLMDLIYIYIHICRLRPPLREGRQLFFSQTSLVPTIILWHQL